MVIWKHGLTLTWHTPLHLALAPGEVLHSMQQPATPSWSRHGPLIHRGMYRWQQQWGPWIQGTGTCNTSTGSPAGRVCQAVQACVLHYWSSGSCAKCGEFPLFGSLPAHNLLSLPPLPPSLASPLSWFQTLAAVSTWSLRWFHWQGGTHSSFIPASCSNTSEAVVIPVRGCRHFFKLTSLHQMCPEGIGFWLELSDKVKKKVIKGVTPWEGQTFLVHWNKQKASRALSLSGWTCK